ncbi:flavin reductase family protein [Geosporobacter ferrireducens]|uniref:Flavin reductase like domain-containing protein n=1 Tax=Geosporobacter ferrireducens TaxID=1424294 RepID=A0A1D8GD75_9FIRM|nr:flavin reductase family protein [Geosporobacter ferrireducens]AOT68854.1 hypothetical protein Gferi_04365 [Geosporobacter ferrireducens]MTI54913.1 flavin reductase family protein [Geosporobacter ferrireducens]
MENDSIKVGLRKIPNPIGLVTAQFNEKKDVTTVAWISKVSNIPPLVMVSIAPERYIHDLIKQSGEFTLAILAEKQEQLALYCGSKTGYDVDKFQEAKIMTEKPFYVKAPLIQNAVVNLECKVQDLYTAGDHTLFIGEVLAAYHNEDVVKPLVLTDKISSLQF